MTILKALLFLIVVSSACATSNTCKVKDTCSCTLDTGEVISLHAINDPNTPRFTMTEIASSWKFGYNPCTPFNHAPGCTDTLVCQYDDDTLKKSYPIGKPDTLTTKYEDDNLLFVYDGGNIGGVDRKAQITLKCDKNADIPTTTAVIEEVFSEIVYYKFTLTSKCACPNGCSPSDGKRNLGTGSILCILLFVFTMIYIVGGILFLKYHKKLEGKDMIPNYEFWKDMPSKVKDGVMFTKEIVSGKKGEYISIK